MCRTHKSLLLNTIFLAASLAFIIPTVSRAETNQLPSDRAEKLAVHEWGTFTSLQDETGRALGGINVDDEPVPNFVHQWMPQYVLGPQQYDPGIMLFGKGLPERYPDVTLRLETPVMYFYPPKSQTAPLTLNVDVQFNGGWLSQYYPDAQSDLPQIKNAAEIAKLSLNPTTTSKLSWTNLQIGTEASSPAVSSADFKGPVTDDPVWLTPRNVAAVSVTTPAGESEKYLFYRGVGHIDSPLAVTQDPAAGTLAIRAHFDSVLHGSQSATIHHLWLVKIKPDGAAAYRSLDQIEVTGDPATIAATVKSDFAPADFSAANLDRLKTEMHAALFDEGLFADEAKAMLKTWEKSYFRSGGWRLFYVVPNCWTEHYMPISISQPANITRVMIGRTELVSPEQRELLKQLAASEISKSGWLFGLQGPAAQQFRAGDPDFGDLGVAIPPDYRLYYDLGRFRNALVIDEQSRASSPALAAFINNYSLRPFKTVNH